MKKILIASVLVGILSVPLLTLAQAGPPQAPGWGQIDVWAALDRIFLWLFGILMVVAAISIVIAGYYFVTAQGDPDKVKTARNFVLYALIGVAVAFLSRGLIWLVDNIIRGGGQPGV